MLTVFVRSPEIPAEARSEREFSANRAIDALPETPPEAHVQVAIAADLAADLASSRIDPKAEFALRREGPFRPLGVLLSSSAALREAFAEACTLPEATSYRRARPLLFVALLPLLMLAELDRELVTVQADGAAVRLACDLFLAIAVAFDLARGLPRHPRTTSIVLFGVAARFTLFVAKACGHGIHPAIALAALFAIAGAVAVWTRSPTPSQITRALLARFNAGSSSVAPPTSVHSASIRDARSLQSARSPTRALVLTGAIAALGLPFMLAAAQRIGVGLWPRAALYAGYAALVPFAIERALEHRVRRLVPSASHVALAVIAAFALSLGLANGVHFGVDSAAHAMRCLSTESGSTAERLLNAETREAARNLQQSKNEWAFFAMNVLVVPLAEERVYRDFLQRIFTRRIGRAGAIATSSTLFAIAHLDVYRVAVYQMIPLGIACGIAFEEGGLIAAALTHALWNLHLLM